MIFGHEGNGLIAKGLDPCRHEEIAQADMGQHFLQIV